MAKRTSKEPQTYLGKKMLDPEFQKLYQESKLRVGIAIETARIRHEKKSLKKILQNVSTLIKQFFHVSKTVKKTYHWINWQELLMH